MKQLLPNIGAKNVMSLVDSVSEVEILTVSNVTLGISWMLLALVLKLVQIRNMEIAGLILLIVYARTVIQTVNFVIMPQLAIVLHVKMAFI